MLLLFLHINNNSLNPQSRLDQIIADMGPVLDDLLANSGHALDDLSAALSGDLDAMLNPVREENVTPMATKTDRI